MFKTLLIASAVAVAAPMAVAVSAETPPPAVIVAPAATVSAPPSTELLVRVRAAPGVRTPPAVSSIVATIRLRNGMITIIP